jgi:hypothetical protein
VLPPNPRRIFGNHYVRYENVTKTDAQVLQCNASNKHGYIFANAYLNVLGTHYHCVVYVCAMLVRVHLLFWANIALFTVAYGIAGKC